MEVTDIEIKVSREEFKNSIKQQSEDFIDKYESTKIKREAEAISDGRTLFTMGFFGSFVIATIILVSLYNGFNMKTPLLPIIAYGVAIVVTIVSGCAWLESVNNIRKPWNRVASYLTTTNDLDNSRIMELYDILSLTNNKDKEIYKIYVYDNKPSMSIHLKDKDLNSKAEYDYYFNGVIDSNMSSMSSMSSMNSEESEPQNLSFISLLTTKLWDSEFSYETSYRVVYTDKVDNQHSKIVVDNNGITLYVATSTRENPSVKVKFAYEVK